MRVTFSLRALAQITSISDYIATDNPNAAAAVVDRIEALATLLGRYPSLGRRTDTEDVRVMSIRPYPYLMFYKILSEKDEVRILRVRHTARKPLQPKRR